MQNALNAKVSRTSFFKCLLVKKQERQKEGEQWREREQERERRETERIIKPEIT